MTEILGIIVPVFGMALIGYAAGRIGLLDQTAAKGLSHFVFRLAIPVMLFRSLGRLSLPQIEWLGMFAYYLGAVIMYLGTSFYARLVLRLTSDEAGAFSMGAAFSNSVLLGLPIVVKVMGEENTLPLLLIISCHTTVLFLVGTIYIEVGRAKGANIATTLGKVGRGLATNPIIIGLACGALFNLSGLSLPSWLDEIAIMFGQAAVPCALFSMGLSLCAFKLAGNLLQALHLVVFKLVFHPLLMWALARFLFDLSPLWTAVTVLVAGLPTGVNAYLFASSFETKEATASAAVLISTGLGLFSVSILLSLIGWSG